MGSFIETVHTGHGKKTLQKALRGSFLVLWLRAAQGPKGARTWHSWPQPEQRRAAIVSNSSSW